MQSHNNRSRGTDPRAPDSKFGVPTWVSLLPVSVATFGSPEQPVERLMALQSALAKAVHLVTSVGRFRLRSYLRGLLRFVFDGWHVASWHR